LTSVHQTKLRVAACLRGLALDYPDPACFAQAIRGSAVALRRVGWIVTMDEGVLAAAARRVPPPNSVDPEHLAHVRLFRDPQVAAAAALACMELAIDEIADIRTQDVEEDCSAIRFESDCVPVPAQLRPILRAQRISRVRSGAELTCRFLAVDTCALTARHVALFIRVGLGLANGSRAWKQILASPAKDERWLAEHGVRIRRLKNPRLRTPDRIESDRLRDEALAALRVPIRGLMRAACACPEPHVKPKLLNETFGTYGKRQSPGASHPWRRPW
jgi:hypothetical protein